MTSQCKWPIAFLESHARGVSYHDVICQRDDVIYNATLRKLQNFSILQIRKNLDAHLASRFNPSYFIIYFNIFQLAYIPSCVNLTTTLLGLPWGLAEEKDFDSSLLSSSFPPKRLILRPPGFKFRYHQLAGAPNDRDFCKISVRRRRFLLLKDG